jgi:hypothetical protein
MHRKHKGKTLKTQSISLSLLPAPSANECAARMQGVTYVAKKDFLRIYQN